MSYVWISPLVELDQENEEPKEKSPKLTKIKPKMLPSKMAQLQLSPRQDLNSLVTQELIKLEAERILEVEAKVSERRKRVSMDHVDLRRKSTQNMEQSLQKIQSEVSLQLGWYKLTILGSTCSAGTS